MKLISLRLKNFRQFYGVTAKIRFASGENNITVIHGNNGAGKTALLNAFTWALFNETTPGFLFPDQIVNKRALTEANDGDVVEAWIEVEFEHDNKKYRVKRTAEAEKLNSEPGFRLRNLEPPSLHYTGPDGGWHEEENSYDAIGRVLPQDLHTYFFFDGERIERIVQPTQKEMENVARAAKKLLGIEILIRGIRHLTAARKDLEKELKDIGDEKTVKLLEDREKREKELEWHQERLKEIERNINSNEEIIDQIEDRLRQLSEVEKIQRRRDQLNTELKARKSSLDTENSSLAREVAEKGYAVFMRDQIGEFQDIISALRKKGELPSGIKKQFVDDLLERAKCICERSLKEGSTERKSVESWKDKAGLADVEEKVIRMSGEILKISEDIPRTYLNIDQIQAKRASDYKEISRIEVELEEIKDKLSGSPQEEVKDLQGRLDQANEKIRDLNFERGSTSTKIKRLNEEIESIKDDIEKSEAKQDKQQLAKKRAQAADEASSRIDEIRELLEEDFRGRLEKRIGELFRIISTTPYVPKLDGKFMLRLYDSIQESAQAVAASQGENQILSLSFIGSIIQEAKEYYKKKEGLQGPTDPTYPVVMDSPFGSLDTTYRHQISEHIPAIADQVVVMLTKTQWLGPVEGSMKRRVGKSYILTYYTPRDDVEVDSVQIDGKGYELVKQSPGDYEFTEIREVENG